MILRIFGISLLILTPLLNGCAITYQKEGRRGVFGFAWVEYSLANASESGPSIQVGKEIIETPTPVVQQKTLGLYLDTSENSSGVGLGYRDVIIVVPEVNGETNLDYDTSDPLSSSYSIEKQE